MKHQYRSVSRDRKNPNSNEMNIDMLITYITAIFFAIVSVILLVLTVISYSEKELRAGNRFLMITAVCLLAGFSGIIFSFPASGVLTALPVVMVLALVILSIIKPPSIQEPHKNPQRNVDERDVIFSRMKLQEGSPEWEQYYSTHKAEHDNDYLSRALPGLLSESAPFHDPFISVSADSNFELIKYLHKAIRFPSGSNPGLFSPEALTRYLKGWITHLGAHSTGISELRNYHLYTIRGRGEDRGKEVKNSHKYALAFTVEMDYRNVKSAPASPVVFESSQQYLKAANIALQVSTFLKKSGWDSRAHIDGDYEVICPLVARDAGLGEIGRMGLLITPRLGPRVRIAVVTTNAPLVIDTVLPDQSVMDFCRICSKCAACCPAHSIPEEEMKIIDNIERWKIDSDLCYRYWCTVGTDCGRCISVCPYSHPDNLMHQAVRRLIKRSAIMRRLALAGDNFFYGQKPLPGKIPSWMNPDNTKSK